MLCVALALAVTVCLAGCAEQRIRDTSQVQLRNGDFEQAVTGLEAGLKDHPESATLLAGHLQARTEALTRLTTEASAARAAGRLDEAAKLLERAKPFDPGMKRVGPLMADLDTERRQTAALADAQRLVEQKKPDAALRLLAEALKDNPRHPDLLALQRRLEIDQRQAQVRASVKGLSETRPISLDFRDANLRTVLDVVSRNSGVNFILDKDIRPDIRVTVFLRAAKVEEAIDLVVNTYQLAKKVIDSQTILIYPNTPDKQREHQEQVVRVFYLANAEAKGAAAFLKAMLKVKEPFIDERSNMVALRDSAENVLLAERLVTLYDTAEPEVLLELEVLEVSTNRLTNLGVKFPDTFSLTPLAPAGAAGLTLATVENFTRDRVGVSVAGLLVNLKRTVGDVNTLSSPRIRVKNKEKAKVLIGDKIPLVTATIGTGGFVSDSVSYIDVGLKLDVEPVIYPDDEVAIKVGLEVSSLGTQVKTASGTLAYQIGTRNANTILRLRDGQTQLLAGLISRDERTNASRVPGLGDVPVLGRIFSDQTDSASRTELVLAITPHVLRNLKQPTASESELWVGTEASPRLRNVGGRFAVAQEEEPVASPPAGAQASTATAHPTAPASSNAAPQPAVSTVPAGPPVVQWQIPSEVKAGDVFNATLMLQSGSPLRGASFQLSYQKSQLMVQSAEEGEFFRKGGGKTSFTHAVTDESATEGRVKGGLLRSDEGTSSGQGSLVKLWLKALQTGPVELSVVGVEPINTGAAPAARPVLPPTAKLEAK
jgi:general secretion pathway protein D